MLIHNLEPEATGRGDLLRFGDPRSPLCAVWPVEARLHTPPAVDTGNRLPASLVSRSISNR